MYGTFHLLQVQNTLHVRRHFLVLFYVVKTDPLTSSELPLTPLSGLWVSYLFSSKPYKDKVSIVDNKNGWVIGNGKAFFREPKKTPLIRSR